ncbi:APC family permease [Candidatus Korobacter versatilis]|nr:amino acid permease [Candidatus Koribacter versatilis]
MDYTQASASQTLTAANPASNKPEKPTLVRGMSFLDAVLLLVGGIIGSGLFLTSSDVAKTTYTPLIFMSAWIVGGIVSLLACLSVAELGSMFPEAGGQYVYLREAYGDFPAFLYGWMIFSVNVTGSNATIAAGFAAYAGAIIAPLNATRPIFSIGAWTFNMGHATAISAIVFLTWINVVGLRPAVILQNIATWAKFIAIAGFLVLGFLIGHGSWHNATQPIPGHVGFLSLASGFGVALIAVFWVYDGWVYATWVAGEIKDPQRNVPRSLIYGIAIVAAVILAVNVLYLYAMPMQQMAMQDTVGQAAAQILFFPAIGRWFSALVAIACFGAAACSILSGARVYYAMAADGLFFQKLAEVHPRWRTPAFSLIVQCIWSCALVLTGRYDQLFTFVMFISVIAYAAAASSIFVLRRKRPDMPRPYKCPGYPWVPLAYCVICGAWALNALWSKPFESLAGVGIMLIGAPAYIYWHRAKRKPAVL